MTNPWDDRFETHRVINRRRYRMPVHRPLWHLATVALFVMGGLAGMILLEAFTLKMLWSWFIANKFGLERISLAEAVGITLLTGVLTRHYRARPDNKDYKSLVLFSLAPVFVLFVGWIVHFFL